jgi:hypothetical protein
MKWWAVPLGLAAVVAVVFVAVVLPTLAGSATVPSQLVVHRSPASAAATPSQSPRPHPTKPSASPQPTHSTTVVPPEQPVVRESDDSHGDRGGQGSEEPKDR